MTIAALTPRTGGWTWSRPFLAATLVLLAGLDSAVAASSPQTATTAVIAGSLIDGTGAEPQGRTVILIEGGRIQAVGPALDIPASARIIDLSAMTVLPGFIDLHSHLTYPAMTDAGFELAFVQQSAADFALLGARNAKLALMAGYTSARELGAFGFADVALRDAIDAGWLPGPRLQVAAYALSITGGHCDNNGFLPGLFGAEPGIEQGIANGPQEVRASVRYQVKYGADLIKICATGGVMSFGDSVGAQQFNAAELEAAVRSAHELERRVAAHTHGLEGIKAAVRAGVDSIEHGTFIDDEAARMMAESGTVLVTTLLAGDAIQQLARAGRLPEELTAKARLVEGVKEGAIRRAAAAGVKIGLGTDNVFGLPSENGREFRFMTEAGLEPMQAIMGGTSIAAELMGWEDDVGTILPGRYADLVAVRGGPLQNIELLESVRFVMQGGKVIKQE